MSEEVSELSKERRLSIVIQGINLLCTAGISTAEKMEDEPAEEREKVYKKVVDSVKFVTDREIEHGEDD